MDTDDLTKMAYEIIKRADNVVDVLCTEIGASAFDKKTEDDFLHGVAVFLRRILKSPRSYLDNWNYLEEINIKTFQNEVTELLAYVEKVLTTPYGQRGKPSFM